MTGSSTPRSPIAGLLAFFALALCGLVHAADWIEPGEQVELGPDEGLVAFVIDSEGEVQAITLDRLGSAFSAPQMPGNKAGRYLRLMKLKAGEYSFNRLKIGHVYYASIYYKLRDLPNSRFRVTPGRLNYVGDLVARGQAWTRQIGIRNSGLAALELVDRDFPGLTDRFEWKYVGEYPDEFVEFRNQQRKLVTQKRGPEPELPEPAMEARDWSERLFRAPEDEFVEIDPSGRYVFEARTVDGTLSLKMTDLETSLRRALYLGPESLADLVFVGSSRVVINLRNDRGTTRSVGLSLADPDQLNPVEFSFGGSVVGSVFGSEHEAIVESDDDGVRLFRLDLRHANERSALKDAEELNRKVKDDAFWWVDARHGPRLMLVRNSEPGSANRYRYFPMDGSKPLEFEIPIRENEYTEIKGIDAQGRILALSDAGREQTELVEIDPASGSIKSTLERREGRDLLGIGFSRAGELASVSVPGEGTSRARDADCSRAGAVARYRAGDAGSRRGNRPRCPKRQAHRIHIRSCRPRHLLCL